MQGMLPFEFAEFLQLKPGTDFLLILVRAKSSDMSLLDLNKHKNRIITSDYHLITKKTKLLDTFYSAI